VAGLGLLPVSVRFAPAKTLGRPTGTAYGATVTGYEIHHGIVTATSAGGASQHGASQHGASQHGAEPFLDGCRLGSVWGTSWHGTLENDAFRRAFLTEVAALTGRDFRPAPDTNFAQLREAQLDLLGDLVADHLDTAAVTRLIESGAPAGLPVLPPGAPPAPPGARAPAPPAATAPAP